MPLSRGERRWVWVGAFALAVALGAGLYFAWSRLRDRQVAGEVENSVVQHLKSLPEDDPIIGRYGTLLRLEGEGFETNVRGLGLPTLPMVLERKAVFDKAWAQLTITVHRGSALEIEHVTMQPDQPGAVVHPTLDGGEIWITDASGGRTRSRLWIGVRHPRCPEW